MTPEQAVTAILRVSEGMSRPAYRGQADAEWELLSGAVRRLVSAYGSEILNDENELWKLVDEYHKDQLILPMQVIDGDRRMSDIQRLSALQHQGAATGLLDFTENALAALWFATAELTEKDAKVFVLDIGDHQIAVNGRHLERQSENPSQAGIAQIVYYEPDRDLGSRIVAQQSVFVICNPVIPERFSTKC